MSHSKKPMRMRAVTVAGGIAILGATGAGVASGANAATTTSASTVLAKIKYCESGGNYQAVNASSGASGAYQFLTSTWKGLSGTSGYATAAAAPAAVQDAAALQLYNQAGTSPWAASSSCWSALTSVPSSSSSSTTTTTKAAAAATKTAAATTTSKTATSATKTAAATTTTLPTTASAAAPLGHTAAPKPVSKPSGEHRATSNATGHTNPASTRSGKHLAAPKAMAHTKPAPKPTGSVRCHTGKHGAKHEMPKPLKKTANPPLHHAALKMAA